MIPVCYYDYGLVFHSIITSKNIKLCIVMAVNYEDIVKAHQRVIPYLHRTSKITSRIINQQVGYNLYSKCENFQKGGEFEARSAFNAVLSMSDSWLK